MTNKAKTSAKIHLDIETIPSTDQCPVIDVSDYYIPTMEHVPPHKSLKDVDKIKKYKDEKLASMIADVYVKMAKDKAKIESEWRKESLCSYKGRILCISWGINDEPLQCIDSIGGEKEMLNTLLENIADYYVPSFVGVNVKQFDLPFIFHRALHHGAFKLADIIRVDSGATKYRDEDLMELAFGGLIYKPMISLDNLCKLLGVTSPKGEITGANVLDFYLKGKIEDIKKYCNKDVEASRQCYYKLKPGYNG
jgi:predicted PolB exonuclease-like 3'-5' exonuclease